jgi:hypothetical protein
MKLHFGSVAVLAFTVVTVSVSAQKIKLVEGDLSPLKGQTTINVEFTYDHMSVGKYKNEEEYIAAKTEEYNKKEPGKGDTWAKHWTDDRSARFEPKFIELYEKYSEMDVRSQKDAKYTLIVHTVSTEPGFNVGIVRKNSEIDVEVLLVETADKSKVLAKLAINNIPGRDAFGYDFDTGERISEAYEKCGKAVGKFVKDKID